MGCALCVMKWNGRMDASVSGGGETYEASKNPHACQANLCGLRGGEVVGVEAAKRPRQRRLLLLPRSTSTTAAAATISSPCPLRPHRRGAHRRPPRPRGGKGGGAGSSLRPACHGRRREGLLHEPAEEEGDEAEAEPGRGVARAPALELGAFVLLDGLPHQRVEEEVAPGAGAGARCGAPRCFVG